MVLNDDHTLKMENDYCICTNKDLSGPRMFLGKVTNFSFDFMDKFLIERETDNGIGLSLLDLSFFQIGLLPICRTFEKMGIEAFWSVEHFETEQNRAILICRTLEEGQNADTF